MRWFRFGSAFIALIAFIGASANAAPDGHDKSHALYLEFAACAEPFGARYVVDFTTPERATTQVFGEALQRACGAELAALAGADPVYQEVDGGLGMALHAAQKASDAHTLALVRIPPPGSVTVARQATVVAAAPLRPFAPNEVAVIKQQKNLYGGGTVPWFMGNDGVVAYAYIVEPQRAESGTISIDAILRPGPMNLGMIVVGSEGGGGPGAGAAAVHCNAFDNKPRCEVVIFLSGRRVGLRRWVGVTCLSVWDPPGGSSCRPDRDGRIADDDLRTGLSAADQDVVRSALRLGEHALALMRRPGFGDEIDALGKKMTARLNPDALLQRYYFDQLGQDYVECLLGRARHWPEIERARPDCRNAMLPWYGRHGPSEAAITSRGAADVARLSAAGRTFAEPNAWLFDPDGKDEVEANVFGHAGRAIPTHQGYAYYWNGDKIVGVLPALGLEAPPGEALPIVATCDRRSDGAHCLMHVPLSAWSKDARSKDYVLDVEIDPAPLLAPKRACLKHNGVVTREAVLDLGHIEIIGGNLEPISKKQSADANGCYRLPTGLYDLGETSATFHIGAEDLRLVSDLSGVNFDRRGRSFIRFLAMKLETRPRRP